MKEIEFDETSGGETAETIRTPDDVIGIFGDRALKGSGRSTVFHIASRHSELFQKFRVKARFEVGLFESDNI